MKGLKNIGFALLPFICLLQTNVVAQDADEKAPMSMTKDGALKGKFLKISNKDVSAFLGIPFAEPPTGEKRFKKPVPVKSWDGVRDAAEKSPPCMQNSETDYVWVAKEPSSEDCLHLNVWVPGPCCNAQQKSSKLPILVWIHGGGFQYGSSGMELYDGASLAANGGFIVASINYRVGALGFLQVGTTDAPGNMGLYDQNLALKWIKNNIEDFGGDPESITIMGHSAGAMSVGMHMISPMSRELFSRAIMTSGTPYHPIFSIPAEFSKAKATAFAALLGCANETTNITTDVEDVMACLRERDSDAISKADSYISGKDPFSFLPNYGNDFLPKGAIEAINSGDVKPTELLIGVNRDEGSIFLTIFMADFFSKKEASQVSFSVGRMLIKSMFQKNISPTDKEVAEFYLKNVERDDAGAILKAVYDSFGDFLFVCPSIFFAEAMKKDVFFYLYSHKASNSIWGDWTAANHMEGVDFRLGHPLRDSSTYTAKEREFSQNIIDEIKNFMIFGNPKGENSTSWPKFRKDNPQYMDQNPTGEAVETDFRKEACEFWRKSFGAP